MKDIHAEPKSSFHLYLDYRFGRNGVEQSTEKSIQYLKEAVALGDAKAMCNLAIAHKRGDGVEQSTEKSVQYLEEAAALGDAKAMGNLAIAYKNGEGVEQSLEKAIQYLEKSAALGDSQAMFNLSIAHKRGDGVEQSLEKAIQYLEKSAALGDAKAMGSLAIAYKNGEGVDQSLAKAIQYLEKAADLDDSTSIHNLALAYKRGEGVDQSLEKAIQLFEKAAALGESKSMRSLAIVYRRGEGDEQSFEKAIQYLEKSAALNDAKAMFGLGIAYQLGEGVDPSIDKAIEYYEAAAALGDRQALFNLAVIYKNGEGVEPSLEKSIEYLKKAAELGHHKAMLNLAVSYELGDGVEPSIEKAIEYYEKAAALDDSKAMFNLARHYENGEGVEQSLEKAVEYYEKAAELGNSNATFRLALIIRECEGEDNQAESEALFKALYDAGDKQAYRYLPHPSLKNHVHPALTKAKIAKDVEEEVKRAFSQFQDAIIDIMESSAYTENKPIYHFTRWPAIESILPKERSDICKNVIRLYHEDYMNDPSEGKSLDSIIKSGVLDEQYREVATFMTEALDLRESLTQNAATYMASFTRAHDRLDLWRAYSSDGDGYCFKINIAQADTHIWSQAKADINIEISKDEENEHLYKLYRVKYDEKEKTDCLKSLLEALKPLHEITDTLPSSVQDEIKKTMFYMLGEVVYLFKDGQYSSEEEVRMFERLSLDEVMIDESPIGKLYKPTHPILFTHEDSEIIIGPKVQNIRIAELSLRKRLLENGFSNTKITRSKVNYR